MKKKIVLRDVSCSSIEEHLEGGLTYPSQLSSTLQQRQAHDLTYGIDIIVTSPPTFPHRRSSNYDNNNLKKVSEPLINPKFLTPQSHINGIHNWSHLKPNLEDCYESGTSQDSVELCLTAGMDNHQNAKAIGTAFNSNNLNQKGDGDFGDIDCVHSFKKVELNPQIQKKIPGRLKIGTPNNIHISSSLSSGVIISKEQYDQIQRSSDGVDDTEQVSPRFPHIFHDRSSNGSGSHLAPERMDDADRLSSRLSRYRHDRNYSGYGSAGSTGSDEDGSFHRYPEHLVNRNNGRYQNDYYQWAYIYFHHINKTDKKNNFRIAGTRNNQHNYGKDRCRKKYSTSSSQSGGDLQHYTFSKESEHSRTSSFGSVCDTGKEIRIKSKNKKLSTTSFSSSHEENHGRTMSMLSAKSRGSSFGSVISGRSNGSAMSTSKRLRKASIARIVGVTHAMSKFMKNAMDRRRVSNPSILSILVSFQNYISSFMLL